MNITTINRNDVELAFVSSSELLITDVQSALDLIATVGYETGCNRIIINKSAIIEDFFDLKTKILGEITQKFINYQIKMAIVGDFSAYTSKSLKDYIYESNSGKNFFFLESEEQAIEKLSSIR